MYAVVIHPGGCLKVLSVCRVSQPEDVKQAQHVYAISEENSWELFRSCRMCHPVSTVGKDLDSERERDKSQQSVPGQDPVVQGWELVPRVVGSI